MRDITPPSHDMPRGPRSTLELRLVIADIVRIAVVLVAVAGQMLQQGMVRGSVMQAAF